MFVIHSTTFILFCIILGIIPLFTYIYVKLFNFFIITVFEINFCSAVAGYVWKLI